MKWYIKWQQPTEKGVLVWILASGSIKVIFLYDVHSLVKAFFRMMMM